MKKRFITAAIILCMLMSSTGVFAQGTSPYKDVEGSWAEEAIADLTNRGILGGRGNGLFVPKGEVTRAEFTTIMTKMFGLNVPASPVSFTDVPANYWGKSGIDAVVAAGYMSGLSSTTFGPNKPMTREMAMTAIMATTSHSDLIREGMNRNTGYTDDSKISSWSRGFVYAAKQLGVLEGYPDGSFHPQGTLTRAETAMLFYRLNNPDEKPAPPVTEKPKPPENLAITEAKNGHVSLEWTKVSGAKKYAVYRISNGKEKLLNFTTDTHYTDTTNLDDGPQYYVKTVDGNNTYSEASNMVNTPSLNDREQGYEHDFGYSQKIKSQILSAQPGQVISTSGLVGSRIPQVEANRKDNDDTLIFSDSPEYITHPGIQYKTPVNGKARLYYYCINHILYSNVFPDNLRYGVFIKNTSDDDVKVNIKRANLGGTDQGYESWRWLQVGAEVTYDLLDGDNLNINMRLDPGETRLISPTHFYTPVTYNNIIHGVYDLETNGEAEVYFVALGEKYNDIEDPEKEIDKLPLLEPDVHDRGTYTGTKRSVDLYVDKMQALTLADGKFDPTLQGKDKMLDKDAKLSGNYGLEYNIHVKAGRKMRVIMLAQGGSYQGPIWTSKSGTFMAPKSPIKPFTQGVYIDEINAGEDMTIRWIPPASTYLPVEFVFVEV